jgi:hypothetical protein
VSDLINIVKLRASIRRMFTNDIHEALAELFQNSQRAKAKTVTMSALFTTLIYEDDGHGIKGIKGLETLLTLGGSDYDQKVIEDQNPMGLGINALLTMEDVKTVNIESNGIGIEIDAQRWWDDPTYWQNWRGLVYTPKDQSPFKVTAKFNNTWAINKVNELTNRPIYQGFNTPGKGYEGLLNITLNGKAIDTSTPSWYTDNQDLIYKGEYLGNKIFIRKGYTHGGLVINWYGQLINVMLDGFLVYLEVRQGRPLEPKAPVRKGLVLDRKFEALLGFIKDRVFSEALRQAQGKPLSEVFQGLRELDRERFDKDFINCMKVNPYEGYYTEEEEKDNLIFLKAKPPRVIENLIVHWKETEEELKGLETFANSLPFDIYEERHGQVTGEDIHWYPEEYLGPEKDLLASQGITLVKGGHFTLEGKQYEVKEPVLAYLQKTDYFYWEEYNSPLLGVLPKEGGQYDIKKDLRDTIWALAEPDFDGDGNLDTFESDLDEFMVKLSGGVGINPNLNEIIDHLVKLEGSPKVRLLTISINYEGDWASSIDVRYQVDNESKSTNVKLISP